MKGALPAANEPIWLSINGLCRRWSCSRPTVYKAIREMGQGSYLNRIFLGRKTDQRISLDSIHTWESLHARPEDETRTEVVELRERNTPMLRNPKLPSPRPSGSLRDAWKKLKAS